MYVFICIKSGKVRSDYKWSLELRAVHLWSDHPGPMLIPNVNSLFFLYSMYGRGFSVQHQYFTVTALCPDCLSSVTLFPVMPKGAVNDRAISTPKGTIPQYLILENTWIHFLFKNEMFRLIYQCLCVRTQDLFSPMLPRWCRFVSF